MRYDRIYEDYNTFCSFLRSKYDSALKYLHSFDYSDVELEEMDKDTSEEIFDLLVNNDFVLTAKNIGFIGYNPLFLVASLDNSYSKTISLLSKIKEDKQVSIPSFNNEDEKLEDLLIYRGFVLDKSKLPLLKCSPIFLTASLKNNYEKTMKVLQDAKITTLNVNAAQLESIIWEVFSRDNVKFKNLPPLIKNLVAKYIHENYDQPFTQQEISRLAKNGKIPYTYFSSDAFLMNDKLLEDGCKTYDEYVYLNTKISGGYESKWYCLEDETKLLRLLGKKYKSCKNVEDVIKKIYESKLKREDMSLLEAFAFELYAAKELKSRGLSACVDVFAIDPAMEHMGSHDSKLLRMYINGETNTALKMALVVNHELEHAIQDEYIRTADIVKEYDVDLFSKDRILRTLMSDEDYYRINYGNISFEYDAEFKAYMKTAKMFGLVDVIYEHQNDLKTLRDNAKKVVRFARSEVDENSYFMDMERRNPHHGYFENLNEMFEENMEAIRIKDHKMYLKLLKENPIIRFDYNCESCFERKTVRELVECLDKSDKKGIYYNLLRARIDLNKEDEDAVDENLEELVKLSKLKKYKEGTKKAISKLISMAQDDYRSNKYEGHFYKTGGNKR